MTVRSRGLQAALTVYLRPKPPADLVRLGTSYGGWWIPETTLKPGAVAYCAGAGEDISFDLALLERGCKVATFDPTPRARVHVRSVAPDSPAFRFEPTGWWDQETELRFYAPRNPMHVSHSAVNLQGTSDYFTAQVKPVAQLMRELGDQTVDIIKMDIEGAEYRVIDCLVREGPLPTVLCVEFDQPMPVRRTLSAIRSLQRVGYMLNRIDKWNFTFTLGNQGQG